MAFNRERVVWISPEKTPRFRSTKPTAIMGGMLIDFTPYERLPSFHGEFSSRALGTLVDFLRQKMGVIIGFDNRVFPQGDAALAGAGQFADKLRKNGILRSFVRARLMPDEPPMHLWSAITNMTEEGHQVGGSSAESDEKALMATFAEGLERYIWYLESDYFVRPIFDTEKNVSKKGRYIGASKWASFSKEQRAQNPERELRDDAAYLWIQGTSLVSGKPVYIPAQLVSGKRDIRMMHGSREPLIRPHTTIGLATWPTKAGAQLAGALEAVEREAYMILWLNQLSLPRINLETLEQENTPLAKLLKRCAKYGITVHAIQMLTDAPTHAICVVLEDETDTAPRFTVGLKAHRSIRYAIEKAITEALRSRRGYRVFAASGKKWDDSTPASDVGHRERLYYWGVHAEEMRFMVTGKKIDAPSTPWDEDSEEEHLRRIATWCRDSQLECVSVSLGHSKKNPTDLHIEMVLMPELQPTYLFEQHRSFGGARWKTVPEKFGIASRSKPFDTHPHPFS
ncbi:YcaO-like family protein [Candidatus Kaiserbacteria bacterium]|nr:YcaO-like family protein [Candidatus Kaiserbacteria bacterium]